MSDTKVIAREHDNFSSSYTELTNLLAKVITNGEITQDDFYDIEKAYTSYSNNIESARNILNNIKNKVSEEQNNKKYAINLDDLLDLLTDSGKKNTFYKDDDNNILIDAKSIPKLTLLFQKLSLIAQGLDSDEESSITIAPEFIQLLSSSDILLKAKNIKLEGLITANGGFQITEDGSMKAVDGEFSGEVSAKGKLNTDTLVAREIICRNVSNLISSDISISIDETGDDASEVIDGASFYSVQGFLDALPKNLNGNSVYITVNKVCNENLRFRGFSSGSIYLYMNLKDYKGYIAGFDCAARIFIYGSTSATGIADGVDSTRPSIMPSSLVMNNTYYYSMYFANCNFVTLRSLDIYGQTTGNSYYAIGAEYGSEVIMQNCKFIGSYNGAQARNSKIIMYKNFGKLTNNAARAIYGGEICIQGVYPNGNLVHDDSSTIVYDASNSTPDGTTTNVGNNTNTGTTTTKTVTYTSDYGDTYRSNLYNDWAEDNVVIQGKWGSGANNTGCWFFGNDFAELQGKNIQKVVLKINRITGGSSSNNEAKIVMHNHKTRPSGEPTIASWSKTTNLTINETTTVTITDSTVLEAIQNGTIKGFGLKHTFSQTYYMKCSGVLKATITYTD